MKLLMTTVPPSQKVEYLIERLSETIDELQLTITYLLFDLEATRREKQELQQMLDAQ